MGIPFRSYVDIQTVCEAFDNAQDVTDFNESRRMAEELTGRDQLKVIDSLMRAAKRLGCKSRWRVTRRGLV